MLSTINTLLDIRTSIYVNLLVYSIRKLPLIGRLIKEGFYANLKLKKVVSVIMFVLILLWGFVLRFAYVGLLIYLPEVSLGAELMTADRVQQFVHLFTMLSFVVAGVSNATVLEPKREKYIAVKLMRLSPARYMKASLGYRYVTFLIYLLPAMITYLMIVDSSAANAIVLAVMATLWRTLSEYAHLKLFEKIGLVLVKQNFII